MKVDSSPVELVKDTSSLSDFNWVINFLISISLTLCDLCLQEKLVIGLSNPKTTLNSRNELASKCRHKWKFSLAHCAG